MMFGKNAVCIIDLLDSLSFLFSQGVLIPLVSEYLFYQILNAYSLRISLIKFMKKKRS